MYGPCHGKKDTLQCMVPVKVKEILYYVLGTCHGKRDNVMVKGTLYHVWSLSW